MNGYPTSLLALAVFLLYIGIAVTAAAHVLLHKRNSRAAFGWLGLILTFPFAGAVLYALFGINRVKRKAQQLLTDSDSDTPRSRPRAAAAREAAIEHAGFNVTGGAPRPDISVEALFNGEQAFPRMLDAIDFAQREVLLSTYIFDNDETGMRFLDRLEAAQARGCRVCILVDDVGSRYSFPTIIRELKKRKLAHRRFMPLRLIPPSFSINLRTHRKTLIIDRCVTFAGGMNIGDRQLVDGPSPHRASDLHFRFGGALTHDFVELFDADWVFSKGEPLDKWHAETFDSGDAECRLISDGPDENLDAMTLVIMGTVSCARRRVWIMTPYFLPERQMLGCLQAAALSGVDVRVMIPAENNWPIVQWALQHNMAELLNAGVRIFQRAPPFAHSKCLLIDDRYALVGSTNLDPRSLRLNFELGVEIFSERFNRGLAAHFEQVLPECSEFTHQRLDSRSLPARLRDGASALFSPYL